MSHDYDPPPLTAALDDVPPELRTLAERLAERVHDVWARARLDEGWVYGPARDDAAKTHPGLVPYDALPESEKEYDRRTALGTIQALRSLGYRIEAA